MKLLHPVFPIVKLDKYTPDPIKGHVTNPQPDPEIIDDEEEWEVEKVLSSRRFGKWKKLQYFVRWKGYGHEDDTWVAAESMANAPLKVAEFYVAFPNAIKSVHLSPADASSNWRSASRSPQI
jgi:hypothetical protein